MKTVVVALSLVCAQMMSAFSVAAQTASTDPVRVERKQEARQAARTPLPGEGNPQPAPRAQVSSQDKAEARADRRKNAAAARDSNPGELYSAVPETRPKVPRSERTAARVARNAQVAREVKSGEIKPIGEGSK